MSWRYGFKPYVSVAARRAQAQREVARRMKSGDTVAPVVIEGRTIVATFWGRAWCTNLEGYSDFSNRLPRGRTYVRNGSVVDLKVKKGQIEALVSGSALYTVRIDIDELPKTAWQALKKQCAGKIGSLVELLQGKLSNAIMEIMTDRDGGLFPKPKEIKMRCSCPDYAGMCKHVAAVMYGIGNRLDSAPELLFVVRGLDHLELIEQAIPAAPSVGKTRNATIATDDLSAIFDIEIGGSSAPPEAVETKEHIPAGSAATKKRSAPRAAASTKKAPAARKRAAAKSSAAPKSAASGKTAAAPKRSKATRASSKA
jgi:uncharacterized Zn finger protein